MEVEQPVGRHPGRGEGIQLLDRRGPPIVESKWGSRRRGTTSTGHAGGSSPSFTPESKAEVIALVRRGERSLPVRQT